MRKHAVLLLVFVILGFSPLVSVITPFIDTQPALVKGVSLSALTPHPAILINDDSQFTAQGFTGSGLPGNPYRLENVIITTDNDYAIRIIDTRAHFVIENCHIADDGGPTYPAINLYNATNGDFIDIYADTRSSSISLWFQYCSDLEVTNITLENGQVWFEGTNSTSITDGTFTEYYTTLNIEDSRGCSFTDIIAYEGNVHALNSEYLTFHNVTAEAPSFITGFDIENTNSSQFVDCTSYENEWGFHLHSGSRNTTLDGCKAYDNDVDQFYITGVTNCTIKNSQAYQMDLGSTPFRGYFIENCEDVILRENNATWMDNQGYHVDHSQNTRLYNCTAFENGDDGFYFGYSNNSWAWGCTAESNTEDGLSFYRSFNARIIDCTSSDNQIGIYVWTNSQQAILTLNDVYDNAVQGIFVSGSDSSFALSNTAHHNGVTGIEIGGSDYCGLSDSTSYANGAHGIKIDSSDYVQIVNSQCYDQPYGIWFRYADHGTGDNNEVWNASTIGFWFYHTYNWSLTQTSCHDNMNRAIWFDTATLCELAMIEVYNSGSDGIYAVDSTDISISSGTVDNSADHDIWFEDCVSCELNKIDMGDRGLLIEGDLEANWHHDIDQCTVAKKPLLYLANSSTQSLVGTDYGQIILVASSGINIAGGTFTNLSMAITAVYSDHCVFNSMSISSGEYGYFIYESSAIALEKCNSYSNYVEGIAAINSPYLEISDCQISSSIRGIRVVNSDNSEIHHSTISLCNEGIVLDTCENSLVYSNNIYDINTNALEFDNSLYCAGSSNQILRSGTGMLFSSAQHCNLTDSTIDDCPIGAAFANSDYCLLDNVDITNSTSYGIRFYTSEQCSIVDSELVSAGIFLQDTNIMYWNHTFTSTNVNGKPVEVYKDIVSGINDVSMFGHIILMNCTDMLFVNGVLANGVPVSMIDCDNVTLSNFNIEDTYRGAQVISSVNCTLQDWNITNSNVGLYSYQSDYLLLDNITVSLSSSYSIEIRQSSYFTMIDCQVFNSSSRGVYVYSNSFYNISNNFVYGCASEGIYIYSSSFGNTVGNGVFYNNIGIYVYSGEGHILYDNEIGWNNLYNAYDSGTGTFWDDNVDTGNAWQDWSGAGFYDVEGPSGGVDHYPQGLSTPTPVISTPDDITYFVGQTGNSITWNIAGSYLTHYSVTRNSSLVIAGSMCSLPVLIFADNLVVGTHIYMISVWNALSVASIDTVIVRVNATTTPNLVGPNDFDYDEGETGNYIEWTASDLYPDTYDILLDGVSIYSDDWNGSSLSVNVDGLTPGIYNYTLIVTSLSGPSSVDTVFVTVNEVSTTTTSTTSETTTSTTIITSTTTPTDGDNLPMDLIIIAIGGAGVVVVIIFAIILKKKT